MLWIRISLLDPDPYYEILKKVKYSVILNFDDFSTFFDIILFSVGTKMSRKVLDPAGSVIKWPSGSGILDYRSADPDQKEIFTNPQNW